MTPAGVHQPSPASPSLRYMAKLLIKDEEGVERTHELTDEVTTFGRSSNCTVQISDPKSSRTHFRIEKDGEFFKIVDLGSTNGTRLNGEKTTQERLKPGDVLSVGKTTFTFEPDLAPKAEAPPVIEFDATMPAAALAAEQTAHFDRADSKKETQKAPEAKPEARPDGPKYVLAVLEGKQAGERFELGHEAFTIGRSSNNKYRIEDDAASNYHAEIGKAPIGYVISDLGSTNGTRVKASSASEFEKIVKTPLAPGMQIRIGKTIIEFRNVGEPAAEDKLFGTVVLDEDKLPQAGPELAPRPEGKATSPALLGLVALVIFGAAIWLVVSLAPNTQSTATGKKKDGPVAPVARTGNLVENGNFSQGTDDFGNPKGWRSIPGVPNVRVVVDKDAERKANQPEEARWGLRISKAGKGPNQSVVETMDSVGVEPGKVYEISGALRNDGDGQFGLRVVWMKGERESPYHPVVLSGTQQEWKDKTALVRPPAWADRARIGVFTMGREGKTSFDEVTFQEKPGASLAAPPTVAYGGVSVDFEGNKGAFSINSGGIPSLERGLLELVGKDDQAETSLISAIEAQPVEEGGRVTYRSQLFDFMLQRPTHYLVSALKGAGGVQMRFAVDRPEGEGSLPRLSFFLIGATAKGEVEAATASGAKKLGAMEGGTLKDVNEILFNSGAKPQLYLNFAAPVEITTSREGERRLVQVDFKGELAMDIAPENVGVKQQYANHAKDLDDAASAGQWVLVFKMAEVLERKYAAIPEAAEKARKAKQAFERAFDEAKKDIETQIETVRKLPAAADAAKKALEARKAAWAGTPKEAEFTIAINQIESLAKAGLADVKSKEADLKLKSAQRAFDAGNFSVCNSFCRVILRDYADTPAAKDAQELLARGEEAEKKVALLTDITLRLKAKAKPFHQAGDYAGAIKIIRDDADYKNHRLELKEINEYLDILQKKAQE